jgi:hypothetical protein
MCCPHCRNLRDRWPNFMKEKTITKLLSANDTGETGGHQAGILVPKEESLLLFFPKLDAGLHNPRAHLHFIDSVGDKWEFAFIYYNNRLFGGTRNEYRLTRMTRYIREAGLIPGDELIFIHDERGCYRVSYRKSRAPVLVAKNVIRLGSGWRVIDI